MHSKSYQKFKSSNPRTEELKKSERIKDRPWKMPLRQDDYKLPHEGYVSIQRTINNGPNGSLDPVRFGRYLKTLTSKNYYKIDDWNVIKELTGHRICYIVSEDDILKYRSGGFLVAVFDEYIQYKGFNQAIYHVQKENLRDIYILLSKKDIEKYFAGPIKPNVVILDKPEVTDYDEYVLSVNDVPIKVFRNNYDMERFMKTGKYQRILKYGYEFK